MFIYRYVKLKSATRKWEDLLNSQFRLHFFKVLQSIMLGSRVDDVKIVYQHSLIPSQLEELFSNHGSCCSKNCMANLINTCNNNIINSSSSSRSYSICTQLGNRRAASRNVSVDETPFQHFVFEWINDHQVFLGKINELHPLRPFSSSLSQFF